MFDTLTPEQQRVAQHGDGHAIVDAVAGSGKSHTLIARIFTLLERGISYRHILVLMFNTQAREEFSTRLQKAADEKLVTHTPDVATFHSFGLRLCKAFVQHGWLPHRVLLRDGQRDALIREAIKSVNGRLKAEEQLDSDQETVLAVADLDACLKAELLYHDPAFSEADLKEKAKRLQVVSQLLRAAIEYESMRVRKGVMDYIDMLHDPYSVLMTNPLAVELVRNRYAHCLIDEFQDIDELQMQLVRIVAGDRAQMMVVGDGDQCIYAWRGAKPEYIVHRFGELFPDTVRYAMTTTFRYGPEVATLANGAIRHNQTRINKASASAPGLDTDVRIFSYSGGSGNAVLRALDHWDGKRSETAILVREFAHSIPVEIALSKADIPYRLVGAEPFCERKEVLTLYAHLALCQPDRWRGMGESQCRALLEALLTVPTLYLRRDAVESTASQIARIIAADGANPVPLLLNALGGFATASRNKTLPDMIKRIGRVAKISPDKPASEVLDWLIDDMGLLRFFLNSAGSKSRALAKWAMVKYIAAFAKEDKLSCTGLLDALDAIQLQPHDVGDRVLITSAHRAKGLEWPHVIVSELEEGSFPGEHSEDLEGERRLYYVAITRARQRLSLVVPIDQTLEDIQRGQRSKLPNPKEMSASRFVYESLHACAQDDPIPAAPPPDDPFPKPEDCSSRVQYETAIAHYLHEKGVAKAFADQTVRLLSKHYAKSWHMPPTKPEKKG